MMGRNKPLTFFLLYGVAVGFISTWWWGLSDNLNQLGVKLFISKSIIDFYNLLIVALYGVIRQYHSHAPSNSPIQYYPERILPESSTNPALCVQNGS